VISALEARNLTKKYGKVWGLRDCTLRIPTGRVVGLVGPNGAGKTTLLHLAVGLLDPTAGEIQVLGWSPGKHPDLVLARVGFVAQDRPLYRGFRVGEMLELGRRLNPRWEEKIASERMKRLGIAPERKVGSMSGGQQAQVALALALGKCPELLLLDEPVSSLDPLARRTFLQELMDAVAQGGLTVVLSSHLIADLERACDYLVILASGRAQVAGEIDELLQTHKFVVGLPLDPQAIAQDASVIQATHTARQSSVLVRTQGDLADLPWFRRGEADVQPVSLEELVLAYLARPEASALPPPSVEPEHLEVSA
jgi:ABC-2 type transport system ATP-binding protein